jgi:hypothetical protein
MNDSPLIALLNDRTTIIRKCKMQAADTRPKRATQPRPDALPRRAEPDARRQSLIEAAMRVLARAGANGASVRAIAQEAGVSPAWSATISPGSTR